LFGQDNDFRLQPLLPRLQPLEFRAFLLVHDSLMNRTTTAIRIVRPTWSFCTRRI
jgi:hypothetical protein